MNFLKNLKPHEKHRAYFMGGVMFPILMIAQFLGYESIWLSGAVAGITSGLSVVLFPDPDRKT